MCPGNQGRIISIVILMVLACNNEENDNPLSPLPLDHNTISMKIGESWLFQHQYINIPVAGTTDFPDTIIGYSYFSATKDTTIEGKDFLVIDGRDYDVDKDSISITNKRFAIHLGDTALMYEFNNGGGTGFLSGLMKKQAATLSLSRSNYGTSILKKIMLQKLLVSSDYDKSVYLDFVYPMVFPLIKDSAYIFRDTGDPHGNLSYRKRFLGTENLTIKLGQFQAYKIEFLAREAIGNDSILFYDWIGLNGLLKRYIYTGQSEVLNSLNNTVVNVRSYNILELIGNKDINPDTLKPWGKK